MRRRTFLAASSATAAAAALVPHAAGAAEANPLLAPWTGPYGGVPPFDKVKVADYPAAAEAAMAQELAEVDKIANDPAAPTFDNTLGGLELCGSTGERVVAL
jgi:peptidyl-dipeptidase Dcp